MGRYIFIMAFILLITGAFGSKGALGDASRQSLSKGRTGAGAAHDKIPMTDIHDIKPLENIASDNTALIVAIIITALLVILIGACIIVFWKRRKKKLKGKTAPPVPIDKAALAALESISDVENIDGKDFYFRLCEILRIYIKGRYEINAPEMTSEELFPALDNLGLDRNLLKDIKEVFKRADPVKFAGKPPVLGEMEKDILFAGKFIRKTTPESGLRDGNNRE